ncbi:MAG: heavy-metal-associated domain-containing protein [Bacteroidota bacterium]
MRTLQYFETNINCGSCVRSVTPFLDDVEGVTIWRVDVDDPRKVLQVEGSANKADIIATVQQAGFEITPLPVEA